MEAEKEAEVEAEFGGGAGSRQPSAGTAPAVFFRSSLRSRGIAAVETTLFHEKLIAWQVACELLLIVRNAGIRSANLRDQAMRAAQSACLNIAEANGRFSLADRRRVFAIARGEATEAAAAVNIAFLSGECSEQSAHEAGRCAARVAALLSGLIGR